MKKLGIVGAMGLEISLLLTKMKDVKETVVAGRTFYEGTLCEMPAVLVCSGIGKVNSAISAQLLIGHFKADAIVNTGVAGGAGETAIRDIVISTDAVYHDMDPDILAQSTPFLKAFSADETLVQAAKAACEKRNIRFFMGRIATGDQFIADQKVKDDIVFRTQPLAIEMEGAAVAHVCVSSEIPFVVIRSISDNAGDGGEMLYEQFKEIAADDAAFIVSEMAEMLAK